MKTSRGAPSLTPGCGVTTPACGVTSESLSVAYGGREVIRDVSLTMPEGRITAFVGPSGCGKTSLLSCFNRMTDLIPGCRVRGRATVGDRDIFSSDTDVIDLRRRVGMVFQKPNPFPLSIRRNLELPLRELGIRQRTALDEIVERSLSDVGLWNEVKDRLERPAQALSGGQQQRLCLARALALDPEVLLCDEPCSALDPISSGVVEDLIAGLRGRYTVVVVTHNLAQARRIADHAAFFWLRDGCGGLIEDGPADELFDSPRHELTAAYVRGVRG